MLPDKDGPGVGGGQSSSVEEDPSVSLFRDYLRLKTVHPEPDYGETPFFTDTPKSVWGVPIGFLCTMHIIFYVVISHVTYPIRVSL